MSQYDDITAQGVYTFTADETSVSNALTFGIRVHKVMVIGPNNNQAQAALYDAATITGTALIRLRTSISGDTEYQEQVSEDFNPPVHFRQLTADITGSGAIAVVYYTRK